MRKFVVILLSLMLIQFFACAKASDTLKPGETIKMGYIAPITGDNAIYGLASKAVQLAVDEFNEQGGIHGFKIELFIGDSQGTANVGIPVAEELIKINKVLFLIGDSLSAVSLAIAPMADQAKVIMISPGSTNKDLPNKGKFIFRTIMNDSTQAIVFAKYLATVENVKTASVLYVDNAYSKGLAMDFWGEFEKEGASVVAVEVVDPGTRDFKPQLRKIMEKKPEVLYLPNYTADIAAMIKQAKEIGLKAKIYSTESFATHEIFNLAGDSANGVIFTDMADVSESQAARAFYAKYQAKWGGPPEGLYGANAYDAANIILNALKQRSSKSLSGELNIDRDQLRDFIAVTKDYNGASGGITFTPNGDLVANIGIFIAENKEFRQMKAYKLEGTNLVELK